MRTSSIGTLTTLRTVAFGLTGATLAVFAALVLFGGPEQVSRAAWSWAAGGLLFVAVAAIGAAAGRRGDRVMWDEVARADYHRSQRWAYVAAIVAIFPGTALAILAGLDPLRGFVAAALSVGAVQLLLFSAFDRMGR